MLDYDLKNFQKLYEMVECSQASGYRTIEMEQVFIDNNINQFEIEQTIEKLKDALILGY